MTEPEVSGNQLRRGQGVKSVKGVVHFDKATDHLLQGGHTSDGRQIAECKGKGALVPPFSPMLTRLGVCDHDVLLNHARD